MTSDDRLFDVPATPTERKLSPGRIRTIKQKDMLARGLHPAMPGGIKTDDSTCGNCMHCYFTGEAHRRYWKCALIGVTRGPGTDIRLSWPGCQRHERIPGT